MLCDLSIEALFKLARSEGGRTRSDLSIPGLLTDHLTPLLDAGLLETSISTQSRKQAKPLKKYLITPAGQEEIQHYLAQTRLRHFTPARK